MPESIANEVWIKGPHIINEVINKASDQRVGNYMIRYATPRWVASGGHTAIESGSREDARRAIMRINEADAQVKTSKVREAAMDQVRITVDHPTRYGVNNGYYDAQLGSQPVYAIRDAVWDVLEEWVNIGVERIELQDIESLIIENAAMEVTSGYAKTLDVRSGTFSNVQAAIQHGVHRVVRNIVVSPHGDENIMAFYQTISNAIGEVIQAHDQTVERIIDHRGNMIDRDVDSIIGSIRLEVSSACEEAIDMKIYDVMLRGYHNLLPNNQHRLIFNLTRNTVEFEVFRGLW